VVYVVPLKEARKSEAAVIDIAVYQKWKVFTILFIAYRFFFAEFFPFYKFNLKVLCPT
jgi:hypothetical protein